MSYAKCSAENPPHERKPGLKHTRTNAIFKVQYENGILNNKHDLEITSNISNENI
jgi:hypothetical protein